MESQFKEAAQTLWDNVSQFCNEDEQNSVIEVLEALNEAIIFSREIIVQIEHDSTHGPSVSPFELIIRSQYRKDLESGN